MLFSSAHAVFFCCLLQQLERAQKKSGADLALLARKLSEVTIHSTKRSRHLSFQVLLDLRRD